MKKNAASQVIGAQMISATDGTAFTGAVTVYVTGDAGTQAIGSVSSGACAHEGNGFHTYAPAQAETNYDHIGYTFIGTDAVPVTVQVYPTFPQTGDNFARLGAPAGASVSADVAAVKAVLPAALVSGRIDASVGAMASAVLTAAAIAADAITDAKVAADVTIASVTGAVGSVTGAVGSVTGAVGSVTGLTASDVGAIKAQTDNLPADPADASDIVAAFAATDASITALSIPTAIQNADTLLDRNMATGVDSGSPTVRTVRQALRPLRNRFYFTGSSSPFTHHVTKEDDTTDSWTQEVTTSPTADPITGTDPAGP